MQGALESRRDIRVDLRFDREQIRLDGAGLMFFARGDDGREETAVVDAGS